MVKVLADKPEFNEAASSQDFTSNEQAMCYVFATATDVGMTFTSLSRQNDKIDILFNHKGKQLTFTVV